MPGLIRSFKWLIRPRGVSLNANSISVEENSTYQLIATITPSDVKNNKLVWASSDNSVATVSNTGLVTAVSEWNCVITVKTEDRWFTQECQCEIWVKRITWFELNKTSTTITYQSSEQLTLTITPSDATYQWVTWTSSDTSICTVTQTGLVRAVWEWDCIITCTSEDWVHSASCAVTAEWIHVTWVSLNKTSTEWFVWKTEQLTATIAPSNATIKTVTWSSSNTSIATVSSTGLITFKAVGTCTITVTTTDWNKTATCSVTAKPNVDLCFWYTWAEQTRTVTETGCYCIEVWWAQWWTVSSCLWWYGWYAAGKIQLTSWCVLHIFVWWHPATRTSRWWYTCWWNWWWQARVSCYSGTRTYPQWGWWWTDVRYNWNTICHRFIVAGWWAWATCWNCGSVNLWATWAGWWACWCSPCWTAWVWCQTAAGCRWSFWQWASWWTVCNYKHQWGWGWGGWYWGWASWSYSNSSSWYAPLVWGGSWYTYTSSTCGNHPYKACLGNLPLMTAAVCCPGSWTIPTPAWGTQTWWQWNWCVRIRWV